MLKVNLGCGRFRKEGPANVVWAERCGWDIVHDLNRLPYPFEDGAADHIEMDHVLEHLHSPFAIMREIHRILKPGGTCTIRVPHFSRALSHPEHKYGFDFTFPYYFAPTFPGGYTGCHFDLLGMRIRWFSQPYLKRQVLSPVAFHVGRAVGAVIDAFANLSPMFCSRAWCYWVGGFEEMKCRFMSQTGR